MLNIILTIILLLVVGIVVWRGYPLIWATFIILSIVLYYSVFGRLTQLQTPWLIGAGVLWAVGLVLVIKNGSKKTGATVLFLVIMTLALVAMSFWAPKIDLSSVAIETGQKTETAAESTTEPVTLDNFKPDFVQVAGDNTGNKVDATWESTLAKLLVDSGNNYDEASRLLILQKTSSNAQIFAIWANATGLYGDPNNWQSLVKDGKLSPEAQNLWWQFAGVIKTAKAKQVQANSNGYNTAISNGAYGSASEGGISGNLNSSEVTLANGDKVTALERCGNLVLSSKPSNLPTVPTDNPPGGKGGPPITPPPTIEQKNPAESTLVNPEVEDWKKDDVISGNEDGHTVSNENGAEVSNGYQADPVQDAADAADAAADAAAENAATHEDAVNEATDTGGGVVDDNQDHTVTTDPSTDPNW